MLRNDELEQIDREVQRSATPRSACVESLLIVQRSRGWVSDEALRDVASKLGMSAAELESIATFYNLIYRRPVGKHIIHLCDGVTCWMMEGGRVRRKLQDHLGVPPGETTSDGRFTLLPADCLGACDRAPAAIVDEELFGPLDVDGTERLIERLEELE